MDKKVWLVALALVSTVALVAAGALSITNAATPTTPVAHDGPATALFKGEIYVFCRGQDSGMYYQTVGDNKWEYMGGPITSAPSLVVKDDTLYIFVRGGDGLVYYRTTANGWQFSTWNMLSQGVVS